MVHKAIDNESKKSVAIKLIKKSQTHQFQAEVKALTAVKHSSYFPKLVCSGRYEDCYAIVMECLGPSVKEQAKMKQFSHTKILRLGVQLVNALEELHESNIIHRDLKLDNILTSRKDKSKFYLIDLGLSQVYRDAKTKFHYPERNNDIFKGNLLFCSNNVLSGVQASRRDDIISLMLILIFLAKNTLPWMKYLGSLQAMISKRIETTVEILTENLPDGLAQCYRYAIGLGFYHKPDYQWIIGILRSEERTFVKERVKHMSMPRRVKGKTSKKTTKVRKSVTEIETKNEYDMECSTIKMLAPEISKELRTIILLQKAKGSSMNHHKLDQN